MSKNTRAALWHYSIFFWLLTWSCHRAGRQCQQQEIFDKTLKLPLAQQECEQSWTREWGQEWRGRIRLDYRITAWKWNWVCWEEENNADVSYCGSRAGSIYCWEIIVGLKCLPTALLNRKWVVTNAALIVKDNKAVGYEQYKLLLNEIKRVLRDFANFPAQNLLCSQSP